MGDLLMALAKRSSTPRHNAELQRLYDYILDYCGDHHGAVPTIRTIRDALGYSSTSMVHARMRALEDRGLLRRATLNRWYVAGSRWLSPDEVKELGRFLLLD
jgi:SOS-response transcriptional repressor LexA